MTVFSSVLIFFIMSIERCISIYKPLWHRANIRSDHLWKAVYIAWIIALILPVVRMCLYLPFTEHQRARNYTSFGRYYPFALGLILILLITIITVVFIVTLLKAFRLTLLNRKKQIKLVSMLLVMFLLFLVTSAAMAVSGIITIRRSSLYDRLYDRSIYSHYYMARFQTAATVFACTSVVNPTLTLYLKRDFRFQASRIEPKPVE